MATAVKAQDPTRKVFNCIVDDSALAAGLKKGTRDGIRKWFHIPERLADSPTALEHLNRVKVGNDRIGADARDALTWLDEVTSLPNPAVHLQEPDQEYETWEEVEKHLLPATLLSEEDLEDDSELLSTELERSLELEDTPDEASDHTSLSSNGSVEARQESSPKSTISKNGHNRSDASFTESLRKGTRDRSRSTKRDSLEFKSPDYNPKGIAPAALRPLFNHAVWLINREPDSEAALASFIFLTNDITKQTIGRKFGLRAKRLDELRSIIVREEKDLKNRAQFFKKESKGLYAPPMASAPKVVAPVARAEEKPDANEVLFKRGSRGSMGSNGQQVLDPNEFTRTPPPKGNRGGAARGGRGSGRGAPRALFPGSPPQKATRPVIIDPARPIDPHSFSRPSPAGRPVVGGKRRLWEPS